MPWEIKAFRSCLVVSSRHTFLLPSLIYPHFLYSSYCNTLLAALRLEVWIDKHPINCLQESISATVFPLVLSLYTFLLCTKNSAVIPHLHSSRAESLQIPDSEKTDASPSCYKWGYLDWRNYFRNRQLLTLIKLGKSKHTFGSMTNLTFGIHSMF